VNETALSAKSVITFSLIRYQQMAKWTGSLYKQQTVWN